MGLPSNAKILLVNVQADHASAWQRSLTLFEKILLASSLLLHPLTETAGPVERSLLQSLS